MTSKINIDKNNAALVLIDIQEGFDLPKWGERNNPDAEANSEKILKKWRLAKQPIIHIKHDSSEPGSPLFPGQLGNDIKDTVQPKGDEPVIVKHVNSAFIGTDLEPRLRSQNIDTIVLVGLTTDHCVSTTARMAANLGFKVAVVADATATFDRHSYDGTYYTAQQMHDAALASLNQEFAMIVTTQELLQ